MVGDIKYCFSINRKTLQQKNITWHRCPCPGSLCFGDLPVFPKGNSIMPKCQLDFVRAPLSATSCFLLHEYDDDDEDDDEEEEDGRQF